MEQQNQQPKQRLNQISSDGTKLVKSKRIKIVLFALAAVIAVFVLGRLITAILYLLFPAGLIGP